MWYIVTVYLQLVLVIVVCASNHFLIHQRNQDGFNSLSLDQPEIHSKLIISNHFPKEYQYHGTTTLSFVCKYGVIIAMDSRASMGNYVGSSTVKKIFPITKTILSTMAGGAADCSYWIRKTACIVKYNEYNYESKMSVGEVARLLASMLRSYRGFDLSVGTMVAGCDEFGKSSLYYVDDDGRCVEGKLFCVGSGANFAYSVLDSVDNINSLSFHECIHLAEQCLRESVHRDGYSGGYINILLVNGTGYHHVKRIDSRVIQ